MSMQGNERSLHRERRLRIALVLNGIIVVVQVVFGVAAHSLGLLSDAGHNFTDLAALGLSMIAIRVARRQPTSQRSFGWHRGTVLAAQANAASILAITVWISYEGIVRLLDPRPVRGTIVVTVGFIAFLANAIAAATVHEGNRRKGAEHSGSRADLNMRSAWLHLASDAIASLGVAIAGVVMLAAHGWYWLDPAVSLAIAMLIARHAWTLLRATNAVLLEGTPDGFDLDALEVAILATPGVEAVHDIHVWTISSEMLALSAHIVVEGHPSLEVAQLVAGTVKTRIAHDFAIAHATLELESETCEDLGPACDIDTFQPATAPRHGHAH